MNIKELKELINLVEASAIEEFEMERSGTRVRIRKSPAVGKQTAIGEAQPKGGEEAQPPSAAETAAAPDEVNYVFKAPIVGTFYTAPKPDAEPFAKVGDQVTPGTVLCVIEAMKIFNQIECDTHGEIAKVLVENGQPVEYGQPLFEIRTPS